MRVNIHPALTELIPSLAGSGMNVYAYPERKGRLDWIIAERNDNTCVISVTRFHEFTVSACIRPSREHGSGVTVDIEPGDPDTITERVVAAAIKGTEPTVRVRFCKVNPIVPNDGMPHFAWAKLVKVATWN